MSNKCQNKVCPPEKICNPSSGICVLKNGKIGKEIIQAQAQSKKVTPPRKKVTPPRKKVTPPRKVENEVVKKFCYYCEDVKCEADEVCNPLNGNCSKLSSNVGKKVKELIHWTNTADKNGDTELIIAASEGDVQKVRSLLAQGADINHVNINQQTALHYASFYRHKEVVQLLLENGARTDLKDSYGQTYDFYDEEKRKADEKEKKKSQILKQRKIEFDKIVYDKMGRNLTKKESDELDQFAYDLSLVSDINSKEKLIIECTNRNYIDFSKNGEISRIPEVLSYFITGINISYTDIKSIPSFPNLKTLICEGCTKLTKLPDTMINLEQLTIDKCTNITSIPKTLTNLITLSCEGCKKLTSIPEELVNLKQLHCRKCPKITSIPKTIIPRLSFLNCDFINEREFQRLKKEYKNLQEEYDRINNLAQWMKLRNNAI
jgi:hypothetical protein